MHAVVSPSAENRTLDSDVLIYNRVPKCGSTTVNELQALLAKVSQNTSHPFQHTHALLFRKVFLNEETLKLDEEFHTTIAK